MSDADIDKIVDKHLNESLFDETDDEEFEKLLNEFISSEITEEEATTILQKLIQAPSCYPPGNTLEVAQVCKKLFESDQILCDTVSTQPYLPSVLAKIGDGNGKFKK